jgi:hypothetical protein
VVSASATIDTCGSVSPALARRCSSTGHSPRAGTTMWVPKPPWMSLPGIFWLRQMVARPRRQRSHSPQGSTAGTMTALPSHASAPAPAATTRPLISWPSASGSGWLVRTPS